MNYYLSISRKISTAWINFYLHISKTYLIYVYFGADFKTIIHFAINLSFIDFNNSENGANNWYLFKKNIMQIAHTLLLVSNIVATLRISSLLEI
jgi:hypothetical protein